MVDFPDVLGTITRLLRQREIPFMVIGGQAVLLHGEPRLTQDIDITLGIDPSGLPALLQICRELDADPIPQDPVAFVADTFVLPVRMRRGVPDRGPRIDFIFSNTEYERVAIQRAVRVNLVGEAVPFASAEDLIIHKLFAGRARDLEDAASIVRRKHAVLDWHYMTTWVEAFSEIPGRESMPRQLDALRKS